MRPLWARRSIRSNTPAGPDQAVSYVSVAAAQGHLVSHGDYPGFIPAPGPTDALIRGEFMVFGHIPEALERFDAIEGFRVFDAKDNLFRRTLVTVDVGGGRPRQAWTYATCRQGAMPIASADWRKHCGRRRTDVVRRILADRIAREPNFLMQLANVRMNANPRSTRSWLTYCQARLTSDR